MHSSVSFSRFGALLDLKCFIRFLIGKALGCKVFKNNLASSIDEETFISKMNIWCNIIGTVNVIWLLFKTECNIIKRLKLLSRDCYIYYLSRSVTWLTAFIAIHNKLINASEEKKYPNEKCTLDICTQHKICFYRKRFIPIGISMFLLENTCSYLNTGFTLYSVRKRYCYIFSSENNVQEWFFHSEKIFIR